MTRRCETCRFWSERACRARAGAIEAVCINDDGPNAGKYTTGGNKCPSWKTSVFGSLDDPGIDGSPITDAEYDRRVRAI